MIVVGDYSIQFFSGGDYITFLKSTGDNSKLDRISVAVSVSCGRMSVPDTLCIFYILLKGCLTVMRTPGN